MMPCFSALENAEPQYLVQVISPMAATNSTMSSDPPFEMAYKNLLEEKNLLCHEAPVVEEGKLPLIDLKQLLLGEEERRACRKRIARASKEWGFFQVVNHGVPLRVMEAMREEQVKLFEKPFEEKNGYKGLNLNLTAGSYRWGTPAPTSLEQLSWSEAFHVQLNDVFCSRSNHTLRLHLMNYYFLTIILFL